MEDSFCLNEVDLESLVDTAGCCWEMEQSLSANQEYTYRHTLPHPIPVIQDRQLYFQTLLTT